MSANEKGKQRVIRDGLSNELMSVLLRATDYVDHMDLTETERADLQISHNEVEFLHEQLQGIEQKIEEVIANGKRSEAGELMREAMTVRQELLLRMNKGFSQIVKIFLPVLFGSSSEEEDN